MSTAECFSREDGARDENGSCQQSAANQNSGEEVDDPLLKMRKGLFGRSASYLQGEEAGESSQKDGEAATTVVKEKADKSGISSADDEPMEVTTSVVKTTVTATETMVKTGTSLADELAAVDADIRADGKNPVDGEERDKTQNAEKRRDDTDRTQVTTVATVKSTEGSTEHEESHIEVVHKTEESSSVLSVSDVDMEHKEEHPEDKHAVADSVADAGPEGTLDAEASDAAVKEAAAKPEETSKMEVDNEETAKEGVDEGDGEEKATAAQKVSSTKTPERSRKKRVSQTATDNTQGDATEGQETEEGGEAANERRRSLRTRKTVVASDEASVAKNESAAEERRKSLRTPKKTPAAATAPTSAPRTARRDKTGKSASESESAEEKVATSGKSGKKNAPATASASKTQNVTKKETAKKKRGRASESDKDPFSFDSNFDNHPEPLRNIQMERQSFGGYKFTKSPEKTPASRYQKTEQTASERRSNLIGLFPQQEAAPHKSISELTLSEGRQGGTASTSKRKAKVVAGDNPAHMEPGKSSAVLDESVQENEMEGKRRGASEQKQQAQSAYDFQPAPKQRKRKMVEQTPAVAPKKAPKTAVLPELSANEQQQADSRPNEHAPYNVGARIYALWDHLYYPARIAAEQDASGRYEVVFVEDGAVRKLVATGIIPLCNLVVGRKCLALNIKDGEELLEEVEIIEAPSLDDAQQWMDGIFEVKNVDNEDKNKPSWNKLVLDSTHAKSLQAATVNTVRDVVTDNISSVEGRRSRAARHSAVHIDSPMPTPMRTTRRRAPAAEKETPKRSASNTSSSQDEVAAAEPEQQRKEASTESEGPKKATPAKIFTDKTFVVTSAVRKNKEADQGFSKKEIRSMIENGGGKIIDDVMKLPEGKPIFLIADTHYRTHKYLTALARSIPCVSNQWISDCAVANQLLDHKKYMLPAGVSLLTGELKPWHENNGTLLSGKRVFIFSNNVFYEMPDFSEIWKPLITHMGGTVVTVIPPDGLDILLTDSTCTEQILCKARTQGAMIVSSEWIIQAIIHGSLPAPDAHERFKYDFSDACS